jgi:hypothetical protein
MKRIISIVTAVSLMLTLCSFSFRTSAQKAGATKETQETKEEKFAKSLKANWDRLPPQAKLGASPEAKAAWDSLNDKQREFIKAKVRSFIAREKEKLVKDKQARKEAIKRYKESRKEGDDDATLSVVGRDGKSKAVKAKKHEAVILEDDNSTSSSRAVDKKEDQSARSVKVAERKPAQAQKPAAPWREAWARADANLAHFRKANFGKPSAPKPQGGDADGDGLPESFEDALAENFTPIYHTSAGEVDNYATFQDFVPQTIQSLHGQQPVVYYRVVPLYIRYNPYRYMYESFIRIDYLTLWDHDSGLSPDALCDLAPGLGAFEGYGPHDLDNERSALLVSAPVFDPYNDWSFNLDPNQYSALSVFTAAHEDTFTDQSTYHDFPQSPVWAGNHIELWHSLYKHATYTFNPDFLALMPVWIIYTVYFVIEFFFFYTVWNPFYCDWMWDWWCSPGWDIFYDIGFYILLAVTYYVTVFFYGCAVERFHEQGGQFANPRINVGEPYQPINGSHFIQDSSEQSHLYQKLTTPLQFENLIH